MTSSIRGHPDVGQIASTLADIARLLESAEGWDARVRRVLELLGGLVPYECCTFLAGVSKDAPCFILPDTARATRAALPSSLLSMLHMMEEKADIPPASAASGRLVLPVIAADRVIGVLHVEYGESDFYDLQHVRLLSAVASQLGAYLAMAHLQEEGRAQTAQFRALFDATPIGVYLVDADFRIRHVNPKAVPVFGDILNVIGRDFDEVLHILRPKADADEMVERFRHTLETGESYVVPERIEERPDRNVREYYEWQIHRIPLPDGHHGVVCYFSDISAHVRARHALAESENRIRLMAESMPQKIFTAKPNGDVDYFNPQWMEFTGLSFERIRDWGWTQFIHPDDLAETVRAWQHSIDTGEPFQLEHRFRRADGEYRWHISRAVAMRDDEGKVVMWIGSNTDVDDVKKASEVLRHSEGRLLEANRLKDEFLATLSHELRTPLNAVLGWSHMLREGTLSPDTQRRALDSLQRNAKAQAQLVDDLLDVSRIVSGKLQIKSDEVELAHVIALAVDTIRPAAAAKRLDVNVMMQADTHITVTGDADRLQQIAWNLLSNAVKFTPTGGRVLIELRVLESKAEIVVTDSGQGISAEFAPHVFERFRQEDSTVSRKYGGLGLGLAIVRHLTEAHGGTVTADSRGEGQGATFVVRLPIRAVSPRTVARPATDERGAASDLADARVLVVDDQADARDLIRAVLEGRGAQVTTLGSAGEALHALQRRSFNVLLCDIGMPVQDGYALIHAIRALPPERGGRVPAVAVTAYASLRERDKALEAGYNWHLAKPVEPEQLIAIVASAIRPAAREANNSTIAPEPAPKPAEPGKRSRAHKTARRSKL
jgi:PAS domain S-box-containing protein